MKYSGKIGYYSETEECGITDYSINERPYTGDIVRNYTKWQNGESVNDNLNISNQISIVADAFSLANIENMKYITWLGTKWKIEGIEVRYPRLIINVGGVYNNG